LVDVRQLLEYNEEVRNRYFKCLAGLSWKDFIENREASFNSMKNIFVHTLGAIDHWLDRLQNENLRSKKKHDEYKSFDDVRTYMKSVEKRTHDYLDSLTKNKLNKKYVMKDDEGKSHRFTAQDILIHMFEEEVHHRGELIALLWQMGVEPPSMGWKDL